MAAWRAIEHELAAGSALQINAWSVAGCYGEQLQSAALRLLRRASRAAIASDAHGDARPPALSLALDALAAAGIADPRRFVTSAPYGLLRDGLGVPGRGALAA
jgi:tyrosine-protein phosphatase YwqE